MAKNSTFNLFGSAVPVLISVATIPIYLQMVGVEPYSILP